MALEVVALLTGERHALAGLDPAGDPGDIVPALPKGRGFVPDKERHARLPAVETGALR